MTDEGEQIRELYRAYWRCMIDRDVQGLRRMMTEDYTLQHMTGVRQSADAFLRGLQDGTFRYFSAGHDGIEVTVEGDRAILVGKAGCWRQCTAGDRVCGGCGAILPCERNGTAGS